MYPVPSRVLTYLALRPHEAELVAIESRQLLCCLNGMVD